MFFLNKFFSKINMLTKHFFFKMKLYTYEMPYIWLSLLKTTTFFITCFLFSTYSSIKFQRLILRKDNFNFKWLRVPQQRILSINWRNMHMLKIKQSDSGEAESHKNKKKIQVYIITIKFRNSVILWYTCIWVIVRL